MSKREILSYLLSANSTLSTKEIVISLLVSVLLSLFMYWVYKKTYSGVIYSKNFNVTLVLVAIITTVIMLVIGSNLALSLGMVGSLSIIRFRTAVKEPRDIAFLFWAVCIGLSCGARMFDVIAIGSVLIALVLLVFKIDIYSTNNYLLVAKVRNDVEEASALEEIVKRNAKRMKMRMQVASNEIAEVTYEISLTGKNTEKLSVELKKCEVVDSYSLVAYNGEMVG